jgi:hypothetical protein
MSQTLPAFPGAAVLVAPAPVERIGARYRAGVPANDCVVTE